MNTQQESKVLLMPAYLNINCLLYIILSQNPNASVAEIGILNR